MSVGWEPPTAASLAASSSCTPRKPSPAHISRRMGAEFSPMPVGVECRGGGGAVGSRKEAVEQGKARSERAAGTSAGALRPPASAQPCRQPCGQAPTGGEDNGVHLAPQVHKVGAQVLAHAAGVDLRRRFGWGAGGWAAWLAALQGMTMGRAGAALAALLGGLRASSAPAKLSSQPRPPTHVHRQLGALVGGGGAGAEACLQVLTQVGLAWGGRWWGQVDGGGRWGRWQRAAGEGAERRLAHTQRFLPCTPPGARPCPALRAPASPRNPDCLFISVSTSLTLMPWEHR